MENIQSSHGSYPIPSMYGIFTHIWLVFMVNVGKYTIHGSYGYGTGYCKKSLKLTPSHRLHFPFPLFSGVFIHKKNVLSESMFNQFDMIQAHPLGFR